MLIVNQLCGFGASDNAAGAATLTVLTSGSVAAASTTTISGVSFGADGGEIIVVYTPGGGHKFYEELGPISRAAGADRQQIAAVFEKYGMTLLGGPLAAD